MLNYVWIALLFLGIGTALTTDIFDKVNDKYKNGEELYVQILFKENYDKEAQKKIFMPFFSTKPDSGYGLGLSLSQKIIKKHNGDIIIDSEKSIGTTITLLFPVGATK